MNKEFEKLTEEPLDTYSSYGAADQCGMSDIHLELEREQSQQLILDLEKENNELIQENDKLKQVIIDLAPWASAALDDEQVCQQLKDIFFTVVELGTNISTEEK
jgi:hypothetical protein